MDPHSFSKLDLGIDPDPLSLKKLEITTDPCKLVNSFLTNFTILNLTRENAPEPSVGEGEEEPAPRRAVLTYDEYMAKYYASRNTPGDVR
jgi:hypothetical protein